MMSTTNYTPPTCYAACWTCHAPTTVLVDDKSTLTGKRVIAECEREEDAAFIVGAWNSHASLVNALTLLAEKVDAAGGSIFGFADELQHARAALAAAGAA
jgi:hypothetical protein